MRNDLLLVVVAATAAVGLTQAKQSSNSQPQFPQASSTVYFLEDPMWTAYQNPNVGDALKLGAERRWCGYASASALEAGAKNLRPMETGSVEYRGNVILAIHLDQADESGDWDASDDYALDTQGQVVSLHRRFTLIPGDISVDETWSVRDGKATLAKRVTKHNNNVTKYPSGLPLDYLPRFTNLTAFRFEDFFRMYRDVILSRGQVCEKEPPEAATRATPPPAEPPITSWATWRDRLGWTIEYPRDWRPDESCGKECAVSFTDPRDRFGLHGGILVSSLADKPAEKSDRRHVSGSRSRNTERKSKSRSLTAVRQRRATGFAMNRRLGS